ncbi:MAG: hypothetical protein P4L76_17545 [Beijerinckiaceae bacterium]|nr:hypothetical protein [Beijerinckiaceae bacterium]
MTTDHDDEFVPRHGSSPTDQVRHEPQLYGYRPFNAEPDPRPLPEANILVGSISDIFDALVVALADARLEPDWTKHAKAAPFKRNDAMVETLPIGVMHFPGTGIQDNLADKAKKLGIPVWKFGGA